jgi:hypothetical protein
MLIPTKHENLEKNILIIWWDILSLIKSRAYNIEKLFQELKKIKSVSLEEYYDTITFLWTSDLIYITNYNILPKNNDT